MSLVSLRGCHVKFLLLAQKLVNGSSYFTVVWECSILVDPTLIINLFYFI